MSGLMNTTINALRRIYRHARSAFVQERRHRMAIERELFGARTKLSTKNDDDLPSIQ